MIKGQAKNIYQKQGRENFNIQAGKIIVCLSERKLTEKMYEANKLRDKHQKKVI